jgi:hypothetical protein
MIDYQSIRSGPSTARNFAPGFQGAGTHHFHHIVLVTDRTLYSFPGTQDQLFKLKTAILAMELKDGHDSFLTLNLGNDAPIPKKISMTIFYLDIMPLVQKNKESKHRAVFSSQGGKVGISGGTSISKKILTEPKMLTNIYKSSFCPLTDMLKSRLLLA